MILCCPTCGNSFSSDTEDIKCDYCSSETEILISDEELSSLDKNEIYNISEALKEKYKNDENLKYSKGIWEAREEKHRIDTANQQTQEIQNKIINHKITTGYSFDSYTITSYISIISGNVVLGTGILSEFIASIDDMLGTTSSPFEHKMEKAKSLAVEKLIIKSVSIGGNAIIGVDFNFFTLSNNMIAVSVNGTSVVIEKTC